MHQVRSFFAPDRYSAKKMAKPVNFVCVAPQASQVHLTGDFNDWDPLAHPLRRRANRTRSAAVTVPAGSTLHFRYLAEGGRWFDDETLAASDGPDAAITV